MFHPVALRIRRHVTLMRFERSLPCSSGIKKYISRWFNFPDCL